MNSPAILALEDGSIFSGTAIGYPNVAVGEVVFNTSITGYQEILTDPSYCRQIVTLTYPHIGNVGANEEDKESDRVQVSGLVIRDLSLRASNFRSQWDLQDYLYAARVPAITEIDTRQLTHLLRRRGAMAGAIVPLTADHCQDLDRCAQDALHAARAFPGIEGMDLTDAVTTAERYSWPSGDEDTDLPANAQHIVVFDFGVKRSILRHLVDKGCKLTVVPATTKTAEILSLRPDGVLLSNGPGDPVPLKRQVKTIRELLEKGVPIGGICLGHQLLALACGASIVKMPFGHHGANHPVRELDTGKVVISSQNHGFVVSEGTLPTCLRVTHRSLFDNTVQGLAHAHLPARGFQGHPEASPGPGDCASFFDTFVQMTQAAGRHHLRAQDSHVHPCPDATILAAS